MRYGGSFKRKADALARKAWIGGELAALRLPDFSILAEPVAAPTLRSVAERWQASRVDIRESTRIQHRTALGRVLPLLGDRLIDALTPADVAELVGKSATWTNGATHGSSAPPSRRLAALAGSSFQTISTA